MVFWWISWSLRLIAASHGLVITPSPSGSNGLIVSWSHSLLVALMVLWSSCGSNGLMVFSLPLMV